MEKFKKGDKVIYVRNKRLGNWDWGVEGVMTIRKRWLYHSYHVEEYGYTFHGSWLKRVSNEWLEDELFEI